MTYLELLRDRGTRRLLTGLGISSLGDGMSMVTIAWLAVQIAPAGVQGVFVGLAVAAYTLPGVIGAFAFGPIVRRWPARMLVLAHSLLRSGCLGLIVALWTLHALAPYAYVALLSVSSLLNAWGNAGAYTMLSELGGKGARLAANSLASAQVSAAVIIGPSLAGLLLGWMGPGWLILLDAASFAYLGVQAWRTPTGLASAEQPVDAGAAESGFRLLRRPDLLSLTILTWLFFFLYGPVEDALPVYVAHTLHAPAQLLGTYWAVFGIGALVGTLITGRLRSADMRRITLLIVAGWGVCLIPFAFAPLGVTIALFGIGGLIYGPFIPLTYALFQSAAADIHLPSVLAARSAVVMISTPLGTVLGGPVVAHLGAAGTLAASGTATVLLAALASVLWRDPPFGGSPRRQGRVSLP